MKFYNREKELEILSNLENESRQKSKMSVIVGRRRIGKRSLIKKAYPTALYFFVSKKNETLLCEEFVSIAQDVLDIKILGEFREFQKLFEYLLIIAKDRAFTLVIDEFQEFLYINPSIYSSMQNLWDGYKETTKLNLILCGSIYSLMSRIFEDKKEPLFGRANKKIHLKALNTNVLIDILHEYSPNFTPQDLLAFYTLSGGVAKYVEMFVDEGAFSFEKMIDLIFDEHSLFIDEGKNLLIEEFGKEYATYFSILSLICSSKTSRSEIESILGKNIGGYLERLENEYMLIKKIKPIFAKDGSRAIKYEVVDNFLAFWFRFIYKYKSSVEIENFEYVKSIVKRDFSTFSGKYLEKYFIDQMILQNRYSEIGTYWEKQNQNEIDIVAINELEKRIVFAEVKLNKDKIDIEILKQKSEKIIDRFASYEVQYLGLGVEDMV